MEPHMTNGWGTIRLTGVQIGERKEAILWQRS